MNKLPIIFAAFLFVCPLRAAAAPPVPERKTRKELERENVQLKQRLEAIQQELEWLKTDANERDSIRLQLDELYREDRDKEAAGMGGAIDYFDSPAFGGGDYQEGQEDDMLDYTDDVTDSLLSMLLQNIATLQYLYRWDIIAFVAKVEPLIKMMIIIVLKKIISA